jgi:hypothetical protein
MTEVGPNAPLVAYYLKAVEEVQRADEALGDSNAARSGFFEVLKANNPGAVATAQRVVEQVNGMTDNEARAVVSFLLSREKSFGSFAHSFASAANPQVEEARLSEDERNAFYLIRSDNQKIATAMFATLSIVLTKEQLAELPECPKGRRGGAPGPRGKMGRKIPLGYVWTVNGESMGKLSTKDLAKTLEMRIADIRLQLESSFPDSLPDEFAIAFTTPLGKAVKLSATKDDNDPVEVDEPEEEDDDDDDDEDDDD